MYLGHFDAITLRNVALNQFACPYEMRSRRAKQYALALIEAFRQAAIAAGLITENERARIAAKRLLRQRSQAETRSIMDVAQFTTIRTAIQDLGGTLPALPPAEKQPEQTETQKRLAGKLCMKEQIGPYTYRLVKN